VSRTWTREEFATAFERYRKFYRFYREFPSSGTTEEGIVKLYTADPKEQDELRVMANAVKMMNQYGTTPARLKGIESDEEGQVTLILGE